MLTGLAPADVGVWESGAPACSGEVLVVAPHPDDEVLGVGMVMRWLVATGRQVVVVACTDGEASHAQSSAISAVTLRSRRASERALALGRLGVDAPVHRLGLPDGGLGDHVDRLGAALAELCGPDTTVVVPWLHDGHPDHEATARAGAQAATRRGSSLWQVPIWGKVRRDRPYAGRVSNLRLSETARCLKAHAADAFSSQLRSVGTSAEDGPVVHPAELECMLDGFETILW